MMLFLHFRGYLSHMQMKFEIYEDVEYSKNFLLFKNSHESHVKTRHMIPSYFFQANKNVEYKTCTYICTVIYICIYIKNIYQSL